MMVAVSLSLAPLSILLPQSSIPSYYRQKEQRAYNHYVYSTAKGIPEKILTVNNHHSKDSTDRPFQANPIEVTNLISQLGLS